MSGNYELPSRSLRRLPERDERAAEFVVWVALIGMLVFAAGLPFLIAALALRFGVGFD